MIEFNRNTDKFRLEIQKFKQKEMLRTGLTSSSDIFDSSRIEPIPENRLLILKTMYPTIFNYVKTIINTSSDYCVMGADDLLQSATHGALIGIDYYIAKLQNGQKHTAKISVFAYNWMRKYTLEQLNDGKQVSVSRKTTQQEDVVEIDGEKHITKNKKVSFSSFDVDDDEKNDDLKNISNTKNNGGEIEDINVYSSKLFSCLDTIEKKILFLYFGISCSKEYTLIEIAKIMKMNPKVVSSMFKDSIDKLKEMASKSSEFKNLLLNSNLLSNSRAWKM